MNAGTTLAVCVLISVRTFWDPTCVAAPPASSYLVMAGIVTVRQISKSGELQLLIQYTVCVAYPVGYTVHILPVTETIETPEQLRVGRPFAFGYSEHICSTTCYGIKLFVIC